MINKQTYILLSGLFLFNITNTAQQPGLTDELGKQTIKQLCTVGGTQLNDYLNYKKEQNGIISPLVKAQQDHYQAQIDLNNKQMELNEQQKALNDKQEAVTDKQIIEHDHNIFMQQVTEYQSIKNLDPNDPENEKLLKRIKLRRDQLMQDLPELPAEEDSDVKKPDTEKVEEPTKEDGFFKAMATYCVLAATTAATTTDTIAEYSFKNITDLDCFKGTFINKHHVIINRTLIFAILTAATYKGYSLYKAYQAERNFNDEDIFNDDLD